MTSRRLQTHLRARIDGRAPSDSKTASYLNARESIRNSKLPPSSASMTFVPSDNVIQRSYNQLPVHVGWDGAFLLPRDSPLNFTPLRSSSLPGSLDRAVREVPSESRSTILRDRYVKPEFAGECVGTPRREYQGGMIEGVRVRAVFNPYFKPHGQKRKQMDRWKSRDWENWSPLKTAVRGGTRVYDVPGDIVPKRDELGEWTDPILSGRYQADIKRQYAVNGLPWIYKRDFTATKLHILDKEPIGPKRWYKREYRQAKIREAMRNMDSMVEEYRKERKAAKKKTWFEQIVHKLVGGQMASKYITERKLPKI